MKCFSKKGCSSLKIKLFCATVDLNDSENQISRIELTKIIDKVHKHCSWSFKYVDKKILLERIIFGATKSKNVSIALYNLARIGMRLRSLIEPEKNRYVIVLVSNSSRRSTSSQAPAWLIPEMEQSIE